MKPVILLVFLLLMIFISVSYSQIPQTINYQGVLTDNYGQVVPNGNYTLTFRLFNTQTGGTALWEESRLVPVNQGLFDIALGEIVPIALQFDVQYFLGITINTGAELSPRTKLSSVGYSLNTRNIIDNSITTAKIVDGSITQSKLHSGCSLPPGGNAGGDLGGTYPNPLVTKLQGFNISNTSPLNNQVLKWNGTNWTPSIDEVGTVSGTAGGDLSGTYPNPTVSKILGRTLSTTAPTNGQVLSWNGTQWTPTSLSSGMGGSGTSNYLPKFSSTSTIGNSILFESSNKLGLNTTSPDFSLTINSDATSGLGLKIYRTGGASGLSLLDNSQPSGLRGWMIETGAQQLRIKTTGDNGYTTTKRIFTLDRDGNIGIGTNTPSYPLHVSTNRKYAGYFTSDSLFWDTQVLHSEFTGTGNIDAVAIYGYSRPADGFGIGGDFQGGYRGVVGYAYGGPSNSPVYGVSGYAYGTITVGVRYGIYGFASGGATNYGVWGGTSGGTTNYAVYASGNLAYTGTLINLSDIMFKQNINSFSVLSKINQLEPKIFNYTLDSKYSHMNLPSGNHYGLIAQELETVFPELVSENVHPSIEETKGEEPGEEIHYKGVNYMELVPILIQAVKEQQQLINQLTKRIEELEKK